MVNAPTMIEKQNVIQIKILIGARTHLNYYIKKNGIPWNCNSKISLNKELRIGVLINDV